MAPNTVEEYLADEFLKDSSNTEIAQGYLEKLDRQQIVELFDRFLDKGSDLSNVRIPVSILSTRRLSSLELIVKYLREELGLSNTLVASLLGRSPQVCWTTYQKSLKKFPAKLEVQKSKYDIPVTVFKSSLSPLEAVVVHLKGQGLTFQEISVLLNRDPRTIWTAHNRAKKKC